MLWLPACQGLTITAGTGNVSFVGVVGGIARLGALSVTGGTGTTAYIKPEREHDSELDEFHGAGAAAGYG